MTKVHLNERTEIDLQRVDSTLVKRKQQTSAPLQTAHTAYMHLCTRGPRRRRAFAHLTWTLGSCLCIAVRFLRSWHPEIAMHDQRR